MNELVTDVNWLMHLQGIFGTDKWGLFERYFSVQDVENILILDEARRTLNPLRDKCRC